MRSREFGCLVAIFAGIIGVILGIGHVGENTTHIVLLVIFAPIIIAFTIYKIRQIR